MFIGEYRHNLDAKGRLSVPAKFRSALGSSAIITKGLDSCLYIYPKEEWEVMANKLRDLPISSASARSFSRLMLSGAMESEIDKLGRTLLPGFLRDYAGIEGEVVVAGVGRHLEVWDKASWSEYCKNAEENASSNAEQLVEWEI